MGGPAGSTAVLVGPGRGTTLRHRAGVAKEEAIVNAALELPDAPEQARSYRSADPFPHVVCEGLWDEAFLGGLVQSVPRRFWVWKSYHRKNKVTMHKYALNDWRKLPGAARQALDALASPRVVTFLREVTGIADLRPDPTLRGGGLHKIKRGGRLGVHIDFNRNKDGSHRRINLITFLNRDWNAAWGGDLELWNDAGCVRKIPPRFNTTVIFETSGLSWHGHPWPLGCPSSVNRLSLATYYYSDEPSPRALPNDHPTLYHPLDPLTPGSPELLAAACGRTGPGGGRVQPPSRDMAQPVS
jgi:hypothetical protein